MTQNNNTQMQVIQFFVDDYQTLTYIVREFVKKDVVFVVSAGGAEDSRELDMTAERFPVPGSDSLILFYKWLNFWDIRHMLEGSDTNTGVYLTVFCAGRVPAVVSKVRALLASDYFCRGVYKFDFKGEANGPVRNGTLVSVETEEKQK